MRLQHIAALYEDEDNIWLVDDNMKRIRKIDVEATPEEHRRDLTLLADVPKLLAVWGEEPSTLSDKPESLTRYYSINDDMLYIVSMERLESIARFRTDMRRVTPRLFDIMPYADSYTDGLAA